jgi:hypothetical protein
MYTRCGLLRLLSELGAIATPLCLNQIVRFLNDADTLMRPAGGHSRTEGVVLVVAMFLSSVCQSLALQHYIALCFACGAHAKALIQQRVFKAVCVLPVSSVQVYIHTDTYTHTHTRTHIGSTYIHTYIYIGINRGAAHELDL